MATLRDSYALTTALDGAYQAGKAYVTPVVGQTPASAAYILLQAGLAAAATAGKTNFTVTCEVSTPSPSSLRLLGRYWQAFRNGVLDSLSSENLYDWQVTLELNTSDTVVTSIDFVFDFLTAIPTN